MNTICERRHRVLIYGSSYGFFFCSLFVVFGFGIFGKYIFGNIIEKHTHQDIITGIFGVLQTNIYRDTQTRNKFI